MPSAVLIANPAARGFTSAKHRAVVAQLRRRFDIEAAWPVDPETGQVAARQAAAAGVDLVVAMGGDGVTHHVIQGIAGTGVPLGVIPVGTANVLARQLGIPLRTSAAARLLTDDHRVSAEPVLEAEVLDAGRPLRRVAAFSLGVGADAEIVAAAEAEPLRKRGFGALHYAATSVRVVARHLAHRRPDLEVSAGGLSSPAIGAMAQFRSSYTYFGRLAMRVSPEVPDPITLLIVEEMRARRGPAMLRATIRSGGRPGGRPTGLEHVRGFRVWSGIESFEVSADPPALVQADGELVGRVTHLRVTHRRHGFHVVIPGSGDRREVGGAELTPDAGG